MSAETFGRVPDPGFRDSLSRERRPCACGRDVTRAAFESITTAARRHNRTPEHRRWWARVRREWQGEEPVT